MSSNDRCVIKRDSITADEENVHECSKYDMQIAVNKTDKSIKIILPLR